MPRPLSRRAVMAAVLLLGLVSAGTVGAAGTAAHADPSGTASGQSDGAGEQVVAAAAARLRSSPVYLSPDAQSRGAMVVAPALGPDVRVAIVTEDDGSPGQLAAGILARLRADAVAVRTVAVAGYDRGVTEFHAVSGPGATYCKGGADLAARRARSGMGADATDLDALLDRFRDELAKLPPDHGESSCASAEAEPAADSGLAWLWWALGSVVGVAGIGAFALYSRRTVRARRAAGELPEEDEGWISVEYEEQDDGGR